MAYHIQQSTPETCLACCLLRSVESSTSGRAFRQLELTCFVHAMKYSKFDFVVGHLDYMTARYLVRIHRIMDRGRYPRPGARASAPRNVTTVRRNISVAVVRELVAKGAVIIYVDAFALYGVCHYPHFVCVLKAAGARFIIFDPWNGKVRKLDARTLSRGITLLRNHIRLCPQLLIIERLRGTVSAPHPIGRRSRHSPESRLVA